MSINIAVDGPSGAGKSSLAKTLAKRLEFIYVDTGALYRAVGLFALRHKADTKSPSDVIPLLDKADITIKYIDNSQKVYLNGEDVSDKIRTPEVAMAASDVSAIGEVRQFLLSLQRNIAAENNVIMDGRDVGTVILPDAQVKIFLTADAETRAKRRFDELMTKNPDNSLTYERVLEETKRRDHNDSTRKIAPLKKADDAVVLDNTNLNESQTLEKALNIIRGKVNV